MKKVTVGILIVLLLFVVIGYILPDEMNVSRSMSFRAEPRVVHRCVATLHTWPEWSAWSKETDPTVSFEFAGPPSGVGARWKWKGEKFEEGELEILESDPGSGIHYRVAMASGLRFDGRIELLGGEEHTTVTWTDEATLGMGPVGGWVVLFMGSKIDAAVGDSQTRSLGGLQAYLARGSTISPPKDEG